MRNAMKLWTGAMVLGWLVGSAVAGDKKPAAKAKAGAACKTSDDCDQSKQMMQCNNNKCEIAPPPPPPT